MVFIKNRDIGDTQGAVGVPVAEVAEGFSPWYAYLVRLGTPHGTPSWYAPFFLNENGVGTSGRTNASKFISIYI